MPGTVLDAEDTGMNKKDDILRPPEACTPLAAANRGASAASPVARTLSGCGLASMVFLPLAEDAVAPSPLAAAPSLNPGGSQSSDVVLLNHWKVRNFEVQRGDIVSLVSPKNPDQKIIKRVIALEGDIVKTMGHKKRYVKVPRGHIWVEGDHHGHSFDSNSFGPVSLGLLHAHATHILWPPERWQKLESVLPPERLLVQSEVE
ncbi:mitochondrial inner membrane protease subunit 2-like [Hyaena hyaena]|uniref:mitochondrial inner membrane protease subunit 2-like n=1 Tax=Hyaena hyaena TaxID=95912 RepID=UPI001922A733|nr:mitochondrial inner membrane protease subunit 2-like [Hyaena hyaena]